MLKYPMIHVICADYVHNIWNPTKVAIKSLMKSFTPEMMRLEFLVNSFKGSGTIKIC